MVRVHNPLHALKNLLLKNTGLEGIYLDVLALFGFSVLVITACIVLFERQL
jgi:hypothetical protein